MKPSNTPTKASGAPMVLETVRVGVAAAPTEFDRQRGKLREAAATPSGSSLIQASLRATPETALGAAREELLPHATELALNDHGVYCLRLVYEAEREALTRLVESPAADDAFWAAMCRKSLHTRRFVQFVLEQAPKLGGERLGRALETQFTNVVCSKEGCIAAQRILDCVSEAQLERLFASVAAELQRLATDGHAHYVVVYMAGRVAAEQRLSELLSGLADAGTLRSIACNRYGSSCLEGLLKRAPEQVGRLVAAAFGKMDDDGLVRVANDAFGNYVVQCFGANAPSRVTATTLRRLSANAARLSFAAKILKHADAPKRSARPTLSIARQYTSSDESPDPTGTQSGSNNSRGGSLPDTQAPPCRHNNAELRPLDEPHATNVSGTASADFKNMPPAAPFGGGLAIAPHCYHVHHAIPQYFYGPPPTPGVAHPHTFADPNTPFGVQHSYGAALPSSTGAPAWHTAAYPYGPPMHNASLAHAAQHHVAGHLTTSPSAGHVTYHVFYSGPPPHTHA